jgi:hypothetical protein
LRQPAACRKKAAELLFIKPTTLNEMIKRYDIRPKRRKGEAGRRERLAAHGGSGFKVQGAGFCSKVLGSGNLLHPKVYDPAHQ